MALVRYHGMEKKTWCGDTPDYWNAIKTRRLWESIQNGFKQKYYTIQRKANGTSKGQPTKRKEKNRKKTITWSTIYNNCSDAGILSQLRATHKIDSI